MEQYLTEMRNIEKKFSGVTALKNVSFSLKPGEVHVLLGENGAGKSTLMKILSGAYEPTSGEIVINGQSFDRLSPKLSQQMGISIIYQELSVINELSVQENIFLGRLLTKRKLGFTIVDKNRMNRETEQLLKDIGLHCGPQTQVDALRISEKQMVEIAKAVAFNSQIIIMDEPTSSLTEEEIDQLFTIIRRLKAAGKGIIYISHKLKEIKQIGDRVTVLKDGEYVGTHNVADVSIDKLITMMVGRELQDKYQSTTREHGQQGEVILEVKQMTRRDGYVKDISFELHQGEILGFSGLVASGRTETMEAIYGAVPLSRGEVWLHGRKLHIRNTYDALNSGIALVTENRRETGFFKNFSIRRNLSIAKQLRDSKLGGLYGLISTKQEKAISAEQIKAMQIKCASIEQAITELSGGNQQKVILGKWMAANSQVIIFDEPTKGIDVGTKSEIYKLMRILCEQGVGVILVSSEMPELLSVCDRILVYYEGHINGEYAIEDATEEKLVYSATVAKEDMQATA